MPEEVAALLTEFKSVFATLKGLPPLRDHENHISLKEGAQAIFQRPYRYPYYQKMKLRKLSKNVYLLGLLETVVVLLLH